MSKCDLLYEYMCSRTYYFHVYVFMDLSLLSLSVCVCACVCVCLCLCVEGHTTSKLDCYYSMSVCFQGSTTSRPHYYKYED